MRLETAARKQAKIKLSLAGSSGSGKSYSAILLAYGLCNDWSKICVIDTENHSASLYSHLGAFNVINLTSPFHPEKYIEAIKLCEQSKIEVIVIDNATHAWSGKGGCLELHEKETAKMKIPNSFTAWNAITPIYQKYLDAIINSSCHVISTLRSKTEYVMSERNGRQVPQKTGTAPMIRDGFDYEMSIAFDLDQQHKAFSTKDRTGLFQDKEPFVISTNTGKLIFDWCNSVPDVTVDDVSVRINDCISIKDLLALYQEFPHFKEALKPEFERRKRQIMIHQEVKSQLTNQENFSQNGLH
jgi:hypothetical protein